MMHILGRVGTFRQPESPFCRKKSEKMPRQAQISAHYTFQAA
ncbi:hypothetical protein [Alysiella filiformis]|nr:hypothetical protein [Alysiella filiformis]